MALHHSLLHVVQVELKAVGIQLVSLFVGHVEFEVSRGGVYDNIVPNELTDN